MTERDSEAPTETEEEPTPPRDDRKAITRKVKGILKKSSARRVKVKTVKPINKTPTQLASLSVNTEALAVSGLCDTLSSDESESDSERDQDSDSESETDNEEDRARKLLKAYTKKIKIRRIKQRSPNSATMYGRIKSKRNKRECFCADSGTGVPIVPLEIVEDHELAWEEVDPDEPGCESASGHGFG